MAKKTISSTELIWLFHEKLKEFDDRPESGLSIAIVPEADVGWSVLLNPRQEARYPQCAKRVRLIQKQLREIYTLKS